MQVSRKLIENVGELKKALNEISVYDFDVYTSMELYYKIANKLNEVIKELMRFEGLVSDEVIKQNEKLIYLLGEGLNIEVVKKINQMVADGTMDSIINHNVFNSLNNKIEDYKEELSSQIKDIEKLELLNDDLIIFASYQSGEFKSNEDFKLYVANDVDKCYPINNKPLLKYVTNRPLWDICCFKHNNKICFIGDYKDNDCVWGGNAFLLIETEDFINYKQTPFKISSDIKNITQTWAPKIFKDNGETYLIYCIQEDNEKYVDTNLLNRQHEKLKVCYSKALDETLTNWSEPVYLNLGSDECMIDPFMIKKDGVYHMYCCYDNNAEIRHYTSSSIGGEYTLQGVVPFPNITEAPVVIYFKNKYYMFVDSHRATGGRDSGFIQVMESDDLYNWYNLRTFKNTARTKMRHFAPIVISDIEDKKKISDLFKKFKLNNNYINANKNIFTSEKNNISYFDLASITPKTTKTIEELTVMPYTIYYMSNKVDSITINKINASKLKNFETFSFVLNSFGNRTLTIKNDSDKGGFLPTHDDLVINGSVGSVIYSFTCLDGYIKCITPFKKESIIRGDGIPNEEDLIVNMYDYECRYVVKDKICVVSYIFKFKKSLSDVEVIVTGLPEPIMPVLFAPTLNNTNDYNTYGTFRINGNGSISNWYGFPPPIDSTVKGSFTYICK